MKPGGQKIKSRKRQAAFGNGSCFFHAQTKLAKETEFAADYVRVRTPHLAKEKMYQTSGHLPYYAESMFPPMEMDEHRADRKEIEARIAELEKQLADHAKKTCDHTANP